MINFHVKNRIEIGEGFHPGGAAILISINDFGHDAPEIDIKYIGVLKLYFDDVDDDKNGGAVITERDAFDIITFVKDNLPTVETIVVHCNAGVSRSAGCAAALSYIFNGTDADIVKAKPLYNRKVFSTILNGYMAN